MKLDPESKLTSSPSRRILTRPLALLEQWVLVMHWNWLLKHRLKLRACGMATAMLAIVGCSLFAEQVYDNSVHDLGYRFDPGLLEVGDEIALAGTARIVTNFTFEYWGENSSRPDFDGYVLARVRFYENDGEPSSSGYPTPGTLLFDSDWFSLEPTPRATLIFEDFVTGAVVPLTRPVPDVFTWTVQFSGLGRGDTAGVDIFSPPVMGSSPSDYWQFVSGSGWVLLTNVVPMNFAALIGAAPLRLTIIPNARNLTISWPAIAQHYRLQYTPSLNSSIVWRDATNTVTIISNQATVIIQKPLSQQFFRLQSRP